MTRIAIFASGNGSNAENLIRNVTAGEVVLLLCNNPKAFVLKRAKELQVPAVVFSRQELDDAAGALAGEATHMPAPEASRQERSVLGLLKAHRIDFIVLAGFLWKIPAHVISAWPGRIVNIHPALLPKYGGAGMYGERVHREVIKNKEKESGITIHVVDQLYDHGPILFQATCPVDGTDTPEALARKIYALEQQYFPVVVDKYIKQVAV
ncbi:MAG: phosphoribosylglycinamide formyltransferase [Bacteroidales bacterium]|nr:phosphoribosylglycinamide formyltransferase [Bacteroidales bacterium]OQB67602.1 MAG: Phosphoribosylglycinamide formyltransferase [Bacteroidetes bacterium ADurb.Bin139]MDD4435946.1 phosphoribosylglycinamide formyltransferase [Bacteroidales bacterium]MDD5732543.1 phosphoribosylglycinamide formyltransferase [Bacteroidales bacterium]HPB78210.1 phosphoribosylglycinamide formyltransferase [Bacteroidales bacterium]